MGGLEYYPPQCTWASPIDYVPILNAWAQNIVTHPIPVSSIPVTIIYSTANKL